MVFVTVVKIKKQAMNVKRNTDERLCNHCCSGKVLHILSVYL